MKLASLIYSLLAAFCVVACGPAAAQGQTPAAERYPYGDPAFTRMVTDSLHVAGSGSAQEFYDWMDRACRKDLGGAATWRQALTWKREDLARRTDPVRKTQREMELASWLHRTIKTDLPRFSLEEGFEFSNALKHGERQCLLQSVLAAGMLQALGADAGVVMVYRNIRGQATNNSHVVCLLKRSDGKDVLVDCSDPTPFVRHQGLMAAVPASGSYKYVAPVYAPEGGVIDAYTLIGTGQTLPIANLRPLDSAFVRSQFYFYRGERTPGGLLDADKTAAGLEQERKHLRTAVLICPENPLAVYMLGRVYLKQGRRDQARASLRRAGLLYARFGWVPQGLRDAQAEAGMTPGPSARL